MEWKEFLYSTATSHKLSPDHIDTLIYRLDQCNDRKTNIQVAVDLSISESEIKDRLSEIYRAFETTCNDLANSQSRGKLKVLRACLWQQYENRTNTNTNTLARTNHDQSNEINALIVKVQSRSALLSQCIAETINIARIMGNPSLEKFCIGELSGWREQQDELPENTLNYRVIQGEHVILW